MNLGDVVNFKCVDGMKFVGSSLSTTCKVSVYSTMSIKYLFCSLRIPEELRSLTAFAYTFLTNRRMVRGLIHYQNVWHLA